MKRRTYAPGTIIIREGDAGEEFFLIRDGVADVLRSSGAPPSVAKVASLGPGHCFGEQALIGNEPRSATVVAHENLEVYTLGKNDFREAMAASPSFREQLNKVFFQRQ